MTWVGSDDDSATVAVGDGAANRASPTRFGRYVIVEEIGAGGMGAVYRAFDPELDRQVAVKVIQSRGGERFRMRLRREAKALAQLSHPNVLPIYDVGVWDNEVYLATEFVSGQDLRSWLKTRHPWREVLGVLRQAATGLAAAHDAGIVHRDFKPANVMLGDDGRVRVVDFGLARDERLSSRAVVPGSGSGSGSGPESGESVPPVSSDSVSVGSVISEAGTVMGSPPYMAPEQHIGDAGDKLADQYAYCVTVWEGLVGRRPFSGKGLRALLEAKKRPPAVAEAAGPEAPQWVLEILARGLAPDPENRWPSMHELLAALDRDPAVRRRKWMVRLSVAALATATAVSVVGYLRTRAEVCSGARQLVREVWGEARREQVRAAIVSTGLSYAPGTYDRVAERLDGYAMRWSDARTEACEATRHRSEQSVEDMTLRLACYEDKLQQVDATVTLLSQADDAMVDRAVKMVSSLPSLGRCDDLRALRSTIPPPEDPEVARGVQRIETKLREARALNVAGRYADAAALTAETATEAQALGYEPLIAKTQAHAGRDEAEVGKHESAVVTLTGAYALALKLRMFAVAAQSSSDLVSILGIRLARFDEARQWAMHAEATALAEGSPLQLGRTLDYMGALAAAEGKYREAQRHQERSIVVLEEALGPDDLDVAIALNNLGGTLFSAGDPEGAAVHFRRARKISEAALGSEHPDIAISLLNSGGIAVTQGRNEDATRLLERALAIWKVARPGGNEFAAAALNNLSIVARSQKRYDEAVDYTQRALAMYETALGPEHPRVASALANSGSLKNEQGDHKGALVDHRRGLEVREAVLDPDHPDVARALEGVGRTLHFLSRDTEALPLLERGLKILVTREADADLLADVRFQLAKVLWDVGEGQGRDRPRALALARQAAATWADSAAGASDATRWLAAHALP